MTRTRKLYLDICDYTKTPVCNIYDNQSDIQGQAVNVHITTERNGWKELSFDVPSTCPGPEGDEPNFRLNYLIAEYRIRAITDDDTDWFIISEPKITHDAFSHNYSVIAGHISTLLKHKSLDLEMSEDEGNNVGTADKLLETILEGSGWNPGYVYPFVEDDGVTAKVRSLSGEAGTGALSFIQSLCEVFEAKPTYHGDTQTVDLMPMNPFAKYDADEILGHLGDTNVFELHYDRNLHNVEKVNNTDSMGTRLYAYGSSGDLNGACTLQNAEHNEYYFVPDQLAEEYCFQDNYNAKYFFKGNIEAGDILIYSDMDISSRKYIWNDTKQEAYEVYKKPTGEYEQLIHTDTVVTKNQFPYLLALDYYRDVGLMTDEQFQAVAEFQRIMPQLYQTSQEAAAAYADYEYQLSVVGESNTGFLKLQVAEYTTDEGDTKVIIDTDEGDHGVIYRTDYDTAERKYFQWHVANELKPNGDPISGSPSVLYIVHDTDPVTYDKVYLKKIYDQNGDLVVDSEGKPGSFKYDNGYPSAVTVWGQLRYDENDRVYLFCTNSMSGNLGAKQVEDEAVIENLANTTKEGTEKHPTYFILTGEQRPDPDFTGYGWLYEYNYDPDVPGELYFCWKSKGDLSWHKVYTEYTPPQVTNDDYFYSLKYRTLWHGENGQWVKYESAAEQRAANMFTKVFYYCRRRDMLYKGLYEYYSYSTPSLPVANYAIPNEFAFYWTFTTDEIAEGMIVLDTINGRVTWDVDGEDHIVTSSVVPLETVYFPAENELDATTFIPGAIDITTGVEEDSTTKYRSGTIKVWETTTYEYNLPSGSFVAFYDVNLKYIRGEAIGSTGTFTTDPRTRYIRIVCPSIPSGYLRVQGYDNRFYINDKPYIILDNIEPDGELLGIIPLTKKFADLADLTYGYYLPTLRNTQQEIKDRDYALSDLLGDMLKDGRWQDSNYIAGDEKRLYDDAMYMHKQISVPETTYSFTYLSMYGVQNEHYYEEHDFKWPDIQITDAAHLVDPEIKVNCWAYVDKIDRWYDQEWKTQVDVDTKLTLASNHNFTDVIARIAEVAKETKLKRSQYENAVKGPVDSSRLEGAIELSRNILNGGASNYYTDDNGNIIFESADGLTAMILGGRGLGIANSKDALGDWEWRQAITGYGLTADEIIAGYLSAERIEAHSITADRLMANVGQELDIGSNKALTLFATVNGSRPAGTVKTTDAQIQIRAGYEEGGATIPAKIDIASGGEIDLTGGKINITSNGTLDLTSSGEFHLRAKGADTINSTVDGLYMGSDGINFGGGKFKVAFSGNTSTVNMTAGYIALGTPGDEATEFILDNDVGKININAPNEINVKAGQTLTLLTESANNTIGQVLIGNGSMPFIIGADTITYNTRSNANSYDRAYIYNGRSDVLDNSHDGVYLGTDGLNIGKVEGNHVIATREGNVDISGTIYATGGEIASWRIYDNYLWSGSGTNFVGLGTSGDYRIWAGHSTPEQAKFSVRKNGFMHAESGKIAGWSISASSLTGNNTGIAKTTNDDDIAFWAGNANALLGTFKVTQAGKLTATDAVIEGSISGSSISGGTISGTSISGGTITGASITGNTIEGGSISIGSGAFAVTNQGVMSATGATVSGTLTAGSGSQIGGWNVGTTTLYSGNVNLRVMLDSGTAGEDFAIWAGANTSSGAPFKVKRNGEVYLTKLMVQKEQKSGESSTYTTETVDLSSNNNRLRGGTILGWDSEAGKMYTTIGDVNFISPSTVNSGWTGNTYTVTTRSGTTLATTSIYLGTALEPTTNNPKFYAYWLNGSDVQWITSEPISVSITNSSGVVPTTYARGNTIKVGSAVTGYSLSAYWDTAYASGGSNAGVSISLENSSVIAERVVDFGIKKVTYGVSALAGITYDTTTHTYTASASAKVAGQEMATDSTASGTEAWDDGYDTAKGYAALPDAGATDNFVVNLPNEARTGSSTQRFSISKDNPSASGGNAYVKKPGGTVVGQISLDDWWSGGVSSVTATAPERQSGNTFSDSKKTVYFNVRSKASNGAVGSWTQVSADVTTSYNQGATDANNAAPTDFDTTVPDDRWTKSGIGPSATVRHDVKGTWKQGGVSKSGTSYLQTVPTNIYKAGYTDGRNSFTPYNSGSSTTLYIRKQNASGWYYESAGTHVWYY